MPPRLYSRYMFSEGVYDDEDTPNFLLTERVPFRYKNLQGTLKHVVKEGDTLFHLAARYFKGFKRPAGLWWIIADFQPTPISDPTLLLEVGRVLYIPSPQAVTEEIFNEQRRSEVTEEILD